MFKCIKEYIQLDRAERRSHLDLSSECIEIGGSSRDFRALLAHQLGTTIPVGCRTIYLCHACNNEKCSNVRHVYWGTPKDNHLDQVEAGTFKTITERAKEKYGEEGFSQLMKECGGRRNK